MFSDETLEKIFANEELQHIPFGYKSDVIRVVSNILAEEERKKEEEKYADKFYTGSYGDADALSFPG